jgi:putative ABC transport system permease protein
MKDTVNSEMDSIGATSISVSLDDNKTDKHFTREQLNQIESSIDNIFGITPSFNVWGSANGRRETYDVIVSGDSEAGVNAAGMKMLYGRYYNKSDVDDEKMVLVASQSFCKAMFGYEEAVGQSIDISAYDKTYEFTIIGVREDSTFDLMYSSYAETPMYMASAPYTSLALAYDYKVDDMFGSFTIYLDSEDKEAVLSQTRSVVENVVGLRGENAVKISSGYGFDATTNSILDIITSVVAIIAAISLLVGGIGVMNIMTVSVTERTREIGIRKSLGARTSSILTQFLAEAAILTFTGGIIGIIFGLTISYIICKVVGFNFTVNPVLVAVVVMISTSIGLFFGIYPAKRAANLDPIEALRTE